MNFIIFIALLGMKSYYIISYIWQNISPYAIIYKNTIDDRFGK